MITYNSYKNNGQKGMSAYVCVGKVGGGLASYVSKGAYRTVFKNLIRLKFNKATDTTAIKFQILTFSRCRRFIMP